MYRQAESTAAKGIMTMRMRVLLSFLAFFMCSSSLFAQSADVRNSEDENKYNFSQFGIETWHFVEQPTKWDGSDWLKLGMVGAGTFLIMQVDQPIRRLVDSNSTYRKSIPIEFGNMWGELYFTEYLFGGLTVYSLYVGDRTAHKIAFEIAQAALYTFYVNGTLKFVIGRARPYMDRGNQSYAPFSTYTNVDHQSLPGGHTGIVMALTTVLSRNAKPVWLKMVAYVPAVLSVVGRVYLDKHWTSDVFFGGAVGYLTATWVVDQHEKADGEDKKDSQLGIDGMSIQPYVSGESYGLGMTLHF